MACFQGVQSGFIVVWAPAEYLLEFSNHKTHSIHNLYGKPQRCRPGTFVEASHPLVEYTQHESSETPLVEMAPTHLCKLDDRDFEQGKPLLPGRERVCARQRLY